MDLANILGGLGKGEGLDVARLTGAITEVFSAEGGVNGLVEKLRAGGLGGAVDSWVSTGSNEPVKPSQLKKALGADTVKQLAGASGLPIKTLLPMLAGLLPQIIDFLTPGGNLPKEGGAGGLGDLGGLIGGLLGGENPLGGMLGKG